MEVLEYQSPDAEKPRHERGAHIWISTFNILGGVLLPTLCFILQAIFPYEEPDWQPGRTVDYIKMFIWSKVAFPFFPAMAWAIVSLLLVVLRPNSIKYIAVRLGLLAGILFSLFYCVVLAAEAEFKFLPVLLFGCVALAIAGMVKGTHLLIRRFGPVIVAILGALTAAALLFLVPYFFGGRIGTIRDLGPLILVGTFLVGTIAPVWSLIIYFAKFTLTTETMVDDHKKFLAGSLLGWFATLGFGTYFTFERLLAEYAKLPTTRPSRCYVCTAAAHGHPAFVRSTTLPDGSRINPQVRWLKAFELLLTALFPRLHRRLRKIYDHLGPPLANCLHHPLLADAAYLSLKPLELLARLTLTLLLPDAQQKINALYNLVRPPTTPAASKRSPVHSPTSSPTVRPR